MSKEYRREHIKEWKKHFGKIPKDVDGRSFEIHHLDGNPQNNTIDNLQCISIQEHYEIHLKQKDYGAAFLIARRMKIKPENISELAKIITLKRIEDGTHNFLDPNFKRSLYHNKGYVVAIDTRTNLQVRIKKEDFDLNHYYVGVNKNRKQKTIHENRGQNKGKKWSQNNKEDLKKCNYCDFYGRGSLLSRWHNGKCKFKIGDM
jgi:hypothetical protein